MLVNVKSGLLLEAAFHIIKRGCALQDTTVVDRANWDGNNAPGRQPHPSLTALTGTFPVPPVCRITLAD